MTSRSITGSPHHYYPYIDGLRGICILAVLFFHLRPHWLPNGYLGVDVFFVISGFVVTASVFNNQDPFFRFLGRFYARRFLRIIPALLLALTVTSLLTVLFVSGHEALDPFTKLVRAAHFAFSNVELATQSNDYFAPVTELNPFTHTWSLAIEEQFYFMFPPLVFLTLLRKKKLGPAIIAFATVVSFSFACFARERDVVRAFFDLRGRFWELGLGVLAYLVSQDQAFGLLPRDARFPKARSLVSILLLGCVIGAFGMSRATSVPNWIVPLVAFSAAFLLLVLERSPGLLWPNRLLEYPPLKQVGKISYSLYLFHWPVIVLMRWTVGLEGMLHLVVALALSFGLACLSYFLVENPIRELRTNFRISDRQVILATCFAVAFSFALNQQLFLHRHNLSLSSTVHDANTWGASGEPLKGPCLVDAIPIRAGTIVFKRTARCRPEQLKRLFVVGDSHVGNYYPLFERLSQKFGYEVHSFSKPGCATFNGLEDTPECKEWIEARFAEIAQTAREGEVLFLPGLRIRRLPTTDARTVLKDSIRANTSFAHRWARRRMVEQARVQLGILNPALSIIIEAPKPLLSIPAYRCADWFDRSSEDCGRMRLARQDLLDYRQPVFEDLRQISASRPGAVLWDPFPILCPDNPEGLCPAFTNGKPLFHDFDHFTHYAAELLYEPFESIIQKQFLSKR